MLHALIVGHGSIPAWAGKPWSSRRGQRPRRVHPRVGGETAGGVTPETMVKGPSPRGRGNLVGHPGGRCKRGSIPAWAGKPRIGHWYHIREQVHPRVGGETQRAALQKHLWYGPSPRGRGNRGRVLPGTWQRGSIPAWAGKPQRGRRPAASPAVHPRVGGETILIIYGTEFSTGPSPRGRGNPMPDVQASLYQRSIPAWAGKPRRNRPARDAKKVHPRVGGETLHPYCFHHFGGGPSPRGRGNHDQVILPAAKTGSIPAWAGKPSPRPWRRRSRTVHPRVGGETLAWVCSVASVAGPSPRGRGNPKRPALDGALSRSIPAWAGKPQLQRLRLVERKVHPRVGGETVFILTVLLLEKGPSPRGRGNPSNGLTPQ